MTELNEEQQQIEANIVKFSHNIQALTVHDDETLQEAGSALIQVKTYQKKVKETFGPAKDAAYKAYKEMGALFNKAMQPLERIEGMIKPMIRSYQAEQKRIADEAQRKAEEAQRKAQVEAQREAEDKRLEQARLLEAQGEKKAADTILEIPVVAKAVVLPPPPTPPKVAGVSMRDHWKAEILDTKALCAAIGAGKASVDYVLPNTQVLDKEARDHKENAFKDINCVRAVNEQIVSGRATS